MLGATPDALRARAAVYAERVTGARVVECASVVGGGTLPSATIPSIGVHVPAPHPDEFARSLRRARRPIVARVDGAGVLLDLRTVAPAEDDEALAALTSLAR
jgi:L-seryl-tRNA(Ser) seleniumtransferase